MKSEISPIIATLEDAVRLAPTVTKEWEGLSYAFRRYGFGEEGYVLHPELIEDVMTKFREIVAHENLSFDCLAAPEPGGFPWAMAIAAAIRTPIIPLRLREKGPDGIARFENLYSRKGLFCGVQGSNEKVVVLDDVLSSGTTMVHANNLLLQRGFEPKAIVVLCNRNPQMSSFSKKLNVPIYAMVHDI